MPIGSRSPALAADRIFSVRERVVREELGFQAFRWRQRVSEKWVPTHRGWSAAQPQSVGTLSHWRMDLSSKQPLRAPAHRLVIVDDVNNRYLA
jgi:hypothetical protein